MNTRAGRFYDPPVDADRDWPERPGHSRFSIEAILESIRNIATVSEALRILGAAVLVASMSVFLLQGWNEGNDVSRYLLLLTQTGMLAAGGFALSYGLKEAKGARLFFGLALVSIPANFTILGALLYSVFQWDGGLTTYPDFATWRIEDVAGTGATIAGAMAVLLPITLFCFAIMARHSAQALSLHFVLLNLLLLLPVRSSMVAGMLALAGALYAFAVIKRLVPQDRALKTGEGKFALMALFIPLGILLFRSMYFYDVDSLMVAMLSLAVFLAARQASLFPDRSSRVAIGLDVLSVPVAMLFAVALTDAFSAGVGTALAAPFFATTFGVLAVDIMRRTEGPRLARAIGSFTSLLATFCFVFAAVLHASALTAVLALAAGLVMLVGSSWFSARFSMLCGIVTVLAAVVFGYAPVLALIVDSSWVALAIFGATTIALGSVIERHGISIKLAATKWLQGMRERHHAVADDAG